MSTRNQRAKEFRDRLNGLKRYQVKVDTRTILETNDREEAWKMYLNLKEDADQVEFIDTKPGLVL